MKIKKEVLDRCIRHDDFMAEQLKDEEFQKEYLRACLEEYVVDGDYALFFKELERVVKSRTTITQFAQDNNLNRSNLSNILKGKVHPSFDTTVKILKGLGAEFELKFA